VSSSSFVKKRSKLRDWSGAELRLFSTQTSHNPKTIVTNKANKMASDEDYMAFLDKVNQDLGTGSVKAKGSTNGELKATDAGVEVPAVLMEATKDAFYISDSDEPFVPVCLKLKGKGLPDEGSFWSLSVFPLLLILGDTVFFWSHSLFFEDANHIYSGIQEINQPSK
jgi:hypothetical protein